MFNRGHIFLRILLAFVFIGVLFAGGYALYRAGFSQGYAQAAMIAASDGQNPVPYIPVYPAYGYVYPPYHYGLFPFFPIVGIFLFGFLLFGIFGAIFRPRRWGYPPSGPHPGHWHGDPRAWGPAPWGSEQPGSKHGQTPAEEGAGGQGGDTKQKD